MSININCSEKFVSTFLRFDSHFTVGTSWGRGWPHARQSGRSLSHTVQTQHTVAFLLPVGLASRKHPTQTPLPHRLSPPRTPFPKSRRSHKELFKEEHSFPINDLHFTSFNLAIFCYCRWCESEKKNYRWGFLFRTAETVCPAGLVKVTGSGEVLGQPPFSERQQNSIINGPHPITALQPTQPPQSKSLSPHK